MAGLERLNFTIDVNRYARSATGAIVGAGQMLPLSFYERLGRRDFQSIVRHIAAETDHDFSLFEPDEPTAFQGRGTGSRDHGHGILGGWEQPEAERKGIGLVE